MNQHLQSISNFIQQDESLTAEEKNAISKSLKEADKELEITTFKLERTEKVKRTTAILLEETIEELEKKRKAVEAQNRELEIETALEKVRAVAMGMRQPEDMLDVCRIISQQLDLLNVKEVRNVQTAIFSQQKGIYLNYEFFRLHDKTTITEVEYNLQPDIKDFVNQMLTDPEAFFTTAFEGAKLKDWMEYQEKAHQFVDPHLYEVTSLHYYFYSIGPGALGISTYAPLNEEDLAVFKRFRNVFELTYRRFVDIEQAEAQAREAKIEASLERMRATAMSMRKSEELITVCETMYKELTALGFTNIRNAQIAIKNDAKKSYTVFEYSDYAVGKGEAAYNSSPIVEELYNELDKSGNALYQKEFSGKQFEDWRTWRKSINDSIDSRIEEATSMSFYLYSIGTGHLGISTFNAISNGQVEILKRFKNVFELSYQRYSDVAKAEAQAREAQIELALERVRARTMAMQKSEELAETSLVLFQQFKDLGETSEQISIGIFNEDQNIMELYSTLYGSQWKEAARVDLNEPVVMKKIHAAWREQKKSLVIDLAGKDLREYNAFRKKLSNLEYREDRWVIHIAFFSKGVLTFSTTEPHPQETIQLLERFAGVFDQTYTRFLDLQKAEAQTRESQIELGLERVRARAMAMQHSDELKELIGTVYNELTKLDLAFDRCLIWVMNTEDLSSRLWMANAESQPVNFYIPHHDNPPYLAFVKAWEDRNTKWQYDLHGQVKKEWDGYVFNETEMKHLPDPVKKNMQAIDRVMFAASFHNFGCLQTAGPEPLKEEQFDILNRFAKVFDLTYTRFNDLKQAEAQTREARIEAALEKVRAVAMSMHISDDLLNVCEVLFHELGKLGFTNIRNAIIDIYDDEKKRKLNYDYSDVMGKTISFVPYDIHPFIEKQIREIRSGEDSFSETIFTGQELEGWKEFRRKSGQQDDPRVTSSSTLHYYFFSISKGSIGISTFGNIDANQLELLKRFRNVFSLSYQRYMDIVLAEAHAREARIELALERVRARTMAMQRSDELMETAVVLFDQLNQLGENIERTIIGLMNEEERVVDVWATRPDGSQMDKMQKFPIDEPILMQKVYAAWRQQKKSIVIDLRGEELESYFQFLKSRSSRLKRESFGERRVENFVFFSKGMLGVISADPKTPANVELYERFAAVFEQTYTRFLDLQKAEAQARESQIELGLERVRARAMAMQKSSELSELVDTVFRELTKLDFALTWCIINIIDESSLSNTVWAANPDIDKAPDSYHMLFEDYPFHHAMMKGWKERKTKYVYTLEGLEKKIYDDYLFSETEFKRTPEAAQAASRAMEKYVVSFSFSNFGGLQTVGDVPLSDANLDILSRFGKVFDLTYTRFNDLKQAEAQARESQIQLALERVRARTMAMQHSDELKEAAALLFQQVKSLGAPAYSCGYNIWERNEKEFTSWMSTQDGSIINGVPNIPLTEDANFIRYVESKQKGEQFFVLELRGERMQEHYEYLKTIPAFKAYFDYAISVGFNLPETQIHHLANFSHGNLLFITLEPCPEFHDVFKRFAAVFEQTYTRFLDLQRAESQARESQIQLAMERVRARTMAMQKSDELPDAANLLFQQVQSLGMPAWSAGYCIWDDDKKAMTLWMSSEGVIQPALRMPLTEDPSLIHFLEAHQREETFFVEEVGGEALKSHYVYLRTLPGIKETLDDIEKAGFPVPTFQIFHCAYFSKGFLLFITYEPVPEAHDIFKRFGKVFEQTYTRFLDLQKAEAQTREAKIEAALERVRSRTMAMHKSDELNEVNTKIIQQIKSLEIRLYAFGIHICHANEPISEAWMGDPVGGYIPKVIYDHSQDPLSIRMYTGWKEGKTLIVEKLEGEALKEHFEYMITLVPDRSVFDNLVAPESLVFHFACFTYGFFVFLTQEHCWEEHSFFKRLAKVFEQTYTRFLDLKKAEAQAREAQIEAALERVRSKAMTMQKSEDLAVAVATVFEELDKLNLGTLRCGIGILDKEKRTTDLWTTTVSDKGMVAQVSGNESMDIHPLLQGAFDAWVRQEEDYSYFLEGKDLNEFYKALTSTNFKLPDSQSIISETVGLQQYYYVTTFQWGGLYAFRETAFPDEAKTVMKRFADVFNLTYTRFNDLQQAEAQTREATIEAALEKVRGRAMAMQNSDDVSAATSVLFSELHKLGIKTMRCGILIIDESQSMEVWTATSTKDGQVMKIIGTLDMTIHPLLQGIYKGWKQKEESFSYHLAGKDMWEYYRALSTAPDYSMPAQDPGMPEHFCDVFFFDEGGLFTFELHSFPNEIKGVLKKFTAVFSLTFRRYQDLKKAEAQAREAIKASSLDRIRAEITSMRTADDLQRITPSVWKELTVLGVPFFRCGVFIINEKEEKEHIYLSTPDGKPLAVLHLDFNSSSITRNAAEHWRIQKVYSEHWNREQFVAWVQSLIGQGQIKAANTYQAGDEPPESLTLQFVPFAQGMLYVGSAEALTESQIELVQALADTFSVAYARYEDFKKLEEAKGQVETSLTELKAAQSQLIQSEKMASLGELTAGIAHEIQNPLNFVNNFSEVNTELIEEMKAELLRGNNEEAIVIANDIADNEQKINHHGKRADAIVKGMLQHSRSSSGIKEPTDINALADEYLRLAYHGLRAKDNSFNATLQTDFDETIGNINIIPQDMGRVILNLITNAFYAIKPPNPLKGEDYEPVVTVSTKKIGDKVFISIKDNGTGIPQKVVDKIFQPFFTTKPTGQGTGLGLSLSYDIIKSHGGELKVETKEGKGSEFIIHLPVN